MLTSLTKPNRWAPISRVRVLAQELALGVDARELVLALLEVGELLVRHVGLDDGRRERERLELALDVALDARRLQAEHPPEAAVEALPLALVLGQLVGRDLDGVAGAVVHQHAPLAVHDLAARRLDLDLADLVVVGDPLVLVAREHLEVPEAEEDHREGDQRDAADDRHAQRQLRGQGGPAAAVVEVHDRLDLEPPQAERPGLARRLAAAAELERVDRERRAAGPGGRRRTRAARRSS